MKLSMTGSSIEGFMFPTIPHTYLLANGECRCTSMPLYDLAELPMLMTQKGWQDQGVTVPIETDEVPRLAEIGRRITEVGANLSDFRNEVRGNFADMVRKDTYAAEREALKDRIVALEQRAKSMQNLMYGALASVAVGVVTMYLMRSG